VLEDFPMSEEFWTAHEVIDKALDIIAFTGFDCGVESKTTNFLALGK